MRKASLESIYKLASHDSRVLFIGSDLGYGVLDQMKQEIPQQFIMEGISEQHIIGMAAGLAMEGFIPYVNTIATFLTRRCYEQIFLDICLHKLPVRLIANGGGGVYAPLGPTHLALEDLSIMRVIPNMTVISPCDAYEMSQLINKSLTWENPIYFRLAKGGDPVISNNSNDYQIGKGILMKKPKDGLFISTGVMTQIALDACNELQENGFECGVLHLHTIKPLDYEILNSILPKVHGIVTVEEHYRIGGLGSAILEFCNDEMPRELSKISRVGIPHSFVNQYGSQISLLDHWGINKQKLVSIMQNKLK